MEVILLSKIHHAFHELSAMTLVFRTIIQIDDQCLHIREAVFDRLPPLNQSIHQAVTRHFGGHPVEKEFIQVWQENANRGHGGCVLVGKIVIGGFGLYSTLPSTWKRANIDG